MENINALQHIKLWKSVLRAKIIWVDSKYCTYQLLTPTHQMFSLIAYQSYDLIAKIIGGIRTESASWLGWFLNPLHKKEEKGERRICCEKPPQPFIQKLFLERTSIKDFPKNCLMTNALGKQISTFSIHV